MKFKVLLIARQNDKFSRKVYNFLKTKSSVKVFFTTKNNYRNRKKFFKKKYDFIICYRAYMILKKSELLKARIASINIHPGPPEYRGIGCLNYALYNNEKFYGLTIHLMNTKIDNGDILFVKRFNILRNDDVDSLLTKTHNYCVRYIKKIMSLIFLNVTNIQTLKNKHKKFKWSKKIYNRKYFEKFYEIKIDKNIQTKLFNKIRSTYYKNYKPYIILNKKKFILNEKK